jgi:hypothetical protein
MQSKTKPASATVHSVSSYAHERRTNALVLETADALRAEQRRVNDATIDSNASKWRYSVTRREG